MTRDEANYPARPETLDESSEDSNRSRRDTEFVWLTDPRDGGGYRATVILPPPQADKVRQLANREAVRPSGEPLS